MRDDDRLEAVLRELHADRVRRMVRWELAKIVLNTITTLCLVIALWMMVDARMSQQERSLADLWHYVDEISGASASR